MQHDRHQPDKHKQQRNSRQKDAKRNPDGGTVGQRGGCVQKWRGKAPLPDHPANGSCKKRGDSACNRYKRQPCRPSDAMPEDA